VIKDDRNMKTTLVALLLFSLALAGCIVEPGGGYDHRGCCDRGHGWFHDSER
jgi:hypothetical protein